MNRIRVLVAALAALLSSLAVMVVAEPAHASGGTTQVYWETVPSENVVFIPACIPGPSNPACDPRGPGSILFSWGPISLTQGGPAVGSITTYCLTTFKYGNDYMGYCTDTLYTPQGVITATGEINESALERFEPQTLNIPRGTLTVRQVVYPNVFKLTLVTH